MKADSPTNDEPVDLGDGYYYWLGDVISDIRHPPFAKALQGLPLHFTRLESKIGTRAMTYEGRDAYFLFGLNRDRFEGMVAAGRWVTLLFGLVLGWLLWRITRQGSMVLCFLTLAFWAFEPNLLAFSGLVLSDIPFTCCFLGAVWGFQRALEKPGLSRALWAGFFSGLAVTCKFSGALLAGVFLVLELVRRWDAGKGRGPKPEKIQAVFSRWAAGFLASALWIFVLYLPGTVKMPGHPWPFHFFWDGFSSMAGYSGHPVFFKGVLAPLFYWDYYPTAFLLKSPFSFLILLALVFSLALLRKIQLPAWQWIPPILFFLAMLPFHQIGIREILAVYPFFILLAARGGEWLWQEKSRWGAVTVGALLVFQVASVGLSFPRHISYFNELIPPDKKSYWLGDSNLDIGQDVKRLAKTAEERGWGKVKLAYFGSADPRLYGMDWDYWRESDLAGPQPGWVYVVNDAFFQLGPAFLRKADRISKGWISEMPPTGRIGDTWYYFEIPGRPNLKDSSRVLTSAPFFMTLDRLNQ